MVTQENTNHLSIHKNSDGRRMPYSWRIIWLWVSVFYAVGWIDASQWHFKPNWDKETLFGGLANIRTNSYLNKEIYKDAEWGILFKVQEIIIQLWVDELHENTHSPQNKRLFLVIFDENQ